MLYKSVFFINVSINFFSNFFLKIGNYVVYNEIYMIIELSVII